MMAWAPCPHGVRTRGKKVEVDVKLFATEVNLRLIEHWVSGQ